MAEVAVHFTLSTLPDDYRMVTVYIPEKVKIKEVNEKDLPPDWRDFPFPVSTQKFGDEFVYQDGFCLLRIPSVVAKGDFNILINPNHKDFKTVEIIKIEKFPFGLRIFQ